MRGREDHEQYRAAVVLCYTMPLRSDFGVALSTLKPLKELEKTSRSNVLWYLWFAFLVQTKLFHPNAL